MTGLSTKWPGIKVLGWRGTMLVVLENVLVVSSGLRDFDWFRVALER